MEILISIVALIGFVLLTGATGLFVAIEFALTGLEPSALAKAEQEKKTEAAVIRRAQRNLSFELSGAQLGITLTTLATGFLAEPVLAKFFTPLLDFLHIPHAWSVQIALALALIVATLLSMVYGELVPKNLAITDPMLAAKITVRPVLAFNRVFKGLIFLFNSTANALVRRFGIEPADELASARSAAELGAVVRNSAEQGDLDAGTARVLDRSLKFGTSAAWEFMTPRSTIEYLDREATMQDVLDKSLHTGFSKFPVADGDLDDALGVIHVKDAFTLSPELRRTTRVEALMRPVPRIPESLDGDAVLQTVRQDGSQVALVIDEYGGTAGMVTVEDVVEELLGEFYDEHDDAQSQDFIKVGTSWDCSGLVLLEALAETTGYVAPEGPYETLGGLIMATLGRIPTTGDCVLLPEPVATNLGELVADLPGRFLARVTLMDLRRVDRVTITPISAERAKAHLEQGGDH